jgi:hypothetical protein
MAKADGLTLDQVKSVPGAAVTVGLRLHLSRAGKARFGYARRCQTRFGKYPNDSLLS